MIDLNKYGFLKYLLFGSLYYTEGIFKVTGVLILPLYFLEKGVSPDIATLAIGIGTIPMAIKFFWGGIVDSFIQRGRRVFIIIGGLFSIISLLIISFIDPGVALIPFTFLLFIGVIGVGFLDVSSDALAIQISTEKERGKINGAMYAGQSIGMASGALLLPLIATSYGYNMVFIVAALIILLIIIFPILIKEEKIVKKKPKLGKILYQEFKKRNTQLLCLFSFLFTISAGIFLILAPIIMSEDFHMDRIQIGFVIMLFTLAIAFGAIVGGFMSDRFGRKNSLYILLCLSILFTGGLIFTNNIDNFTIVYVVIGFLQGGYHAAFLALAMDVTNPLVGATEFSIFTGFANFGTIFAGALSGTLYLLLGFDRVFLYAALLFGPALLVLYLIRLKKNQTDFAPSRI